MKIFFKKNYIWQNLSYLFLVLTFISYVLFIPFVQELLLRLYYAILGTGDFLLEKKGAIFDTGLLLSILFITFSILCYAIDKFKKDNINTSQKIHFLCMTIYFFVLMTLHKNWVPTYGDEFGLVNAWANSYLADVIKHFYFNWQSSATATIFSIVLAKKTFVFWAILNCCFMTMLAHFITVLCFSKQNYKYSFLICLVLLLIPSNVIGCTGWIMTTTAYVWPTVCAMPIFILYKKIMQNEKIKIYEYIVATIIAVWPLFYMQFALIFFCLTGCFILYQAYFKEKRFLSPHAYIIVIFALSIMGLVYTFTCPGNFARLSSEMFWYPNFDTLSLFDKLKLGMLITGSYYFGITNVSTEKIAELTVINGEINFIILPLMFTLLLVFYRQRKKMLCLLQIASLFFVVIFGYLSYIAKPFFTLPSYFNLLKNDRLPQYVSSTAGKLGVYIEIFIFIFLFASLIYSIYRTSTCKTKGILYVLIFLAGFFTRFMLAFSPTVYGSYVRTTYFMTIAIFIVTAFIWNDYKFLEEASKEFRIALLVFFYAIISTITFLSAFEKKHTTIDSVFDEKNNQIVINIFDVKKYDTLRLAVWSANNGQDDLKWYIIENKDKNYKLTYKVDISDFNDIGTYHTDVFFDEECIAGTPIIVSK